MNQDMCFSMDTYLAVAPSLGTRENKTPPIAIDPAGFEKLLRFARVDTCIVNVPRVIPDVGRRAKNG